MSIKRNATIIYLSWAIIFLSHVANSNIIDAPIGDYHAVCMAKIINNNQPTALGDSETYKDQTYDQFYTQCTKLPNYVSPRRSCRITGTQDIIDANPYNSCSCTFGNGAKCGDLEMVFQCICRYKKNGKGSLKIIDDPR